MSAQRCFTTAFLVVLECLATFSVDEAENTEAGSLLSATHYLSSVPISDAGEDRSDQHAIPLNVAADSGLKFHVPTGGVHKTMDVGIGLEHEDAILTQATNPEISTAEFDAQLSAIEASQLQRDASDDWNTSVCKGRGIFAAYLSAVTNWDKRAKVRERCLEDLRAHAIPYAFFIGRPHFPDGAHHKFQGSIATTEEIEAVKRLRAEQDTHMDLQMLPFVDQYKDLSDKVVGILDYALGSCYDLVLKIDDDMCANASALEPLLKQSRERVALYSGQAQFNGQEFISQRGADNSYATYFAGPCYSVSRTLSSFIVRHDRFNTINFQDYGTDSEDNNMGRWFEHAKVAHGDRTKFRRETVPLCSEVSK